MASSRTKNAVRNMFFGFINKIVVLLFPFIIRTIIIKTLSSEFLGLNSLFASLLQFLNLTELGFSAAVIYCMYKPIAENDTKTICALMNLYKKIYRIIGIIVFVLGLLLLPFIQKFIKGSYPANINIYILYMIYLVNTSLTYFLFAYKSALLTAHQRSDITSNINTITSLLQYLTQAIILIIFKNYYLFVIVQIFSTILNNILVAIITNKKYPKYICKGKVDNKIKSTIKKRVSGLMISKICQTTRNSLDSIFISSFLGLTAVAMYSNYYSIMAAVIGIMDIISNSIIAGIGNSIVTESLEKNYNDMNKFNFIYMLIAGMCTICLACLYQPFMSIWMGEEYMFSYPIVILFCIYFYALKMGDIRSAYVIANGLWWENRYRSIAEAIANIVLNATLGYFFGIYGIILGTLISLLIINFGYGSQIIFKYYFKNQKLSRYFLDHLVYATVTFVICFITFLACSLIKLPGIYKILSNILVCIIIPSILYIIIYHRTQKYNEAKKFVYSLFKKIKRKKVKE